MNESRVVSVAGELAGMLTRLAELPAIVDDDAARVDVIAGLERLKSAAAAAQLRVIERFAVSQEAERKALGFAARAARRGVPEQVGLARRVSPVSASRQVSQARALVRELPRMLGLLQAGEICELVATLVVNETGVLSTEDRRAADERIAGQLPGLGVRQAVAVARRAVIEIDQQAVVARAARAREDRRVGCRPAPDTMAVLSALLPCQDGVRAYAALRAHADAVRAAGDERSRAQIMADALVERVTGQASVEGGPVEIGLVMTDTTLLADADTAAELDGYGPIPGELARDIIRRATEPTTTGTPQHGPNGTGHGGASGAGTPGHGPSDAGTPGSGGGTSSRGGGSGVSGSGGVSSAGIEASGVAAGTSGIGGGSHAAAGAGGAGGGETAVVAKAAAWIRRLYSDPVTGTVTQVDSRRRRFTGALATYLVYRDRYCRTPYCEAPIRHLDHIRAHAAGGPTNTDNGRGLCERCNYINQIPGWTARIIDTDRHIVETTTPTGHTYRSHPPPVPGHPPPATPSDQTSDHPRRSHPPPPAA